MNRFAKILLFLALMLGTAVGAKAQGALYHDIAWRYTPAGAFPAGGATITVCSSSATGTPCTPTVTVYADAALSSPVSNPLPQCTTPNQTGCADNLGNFSFYIPSGTYSYTVTGEGLTPYGPIPLQAGISTGIPLRLQVIGDSLVAGDFAFSGWGTGATISLISGSDSSFTFTMTAGTSPSIDPSVTLTFHDGPWTAINSVSSVMIGGSGSFADIQNTGPTNVTALTMNYMDLPVATKTYTISVVIVGRSNLILSSSVINPVLLNPSGFQQIVNFGLGAPFFDASALSTFGGGITGTGNIGALDLGSGALGSGHSWGATQIFPVGSIPVNNLAPCSNGQYIQTIAGAQSCANATFAITINGGGTTTPLNFGNSPAAPSGYLLGTFQYAAGNASLAVPISGTGGVVCSVLGSLANKHLVVADANGNCVDGGMEQRVTICGSGCDITATPCQITSGNSYDTCQTAYTLPVAMGTANYSAQCTGEVSSAHLPGASTNYALTCFILQGSKSSTQLTVVTQNQRTNNAGFDEIDLILKQ